MRALILAGGFATRLWPITLDRPKPLLPVAGRPLLDYLLELIPAELWPVLVSVNRRFAPAFAAWAAGKPVELVVEGSVREEEKLGAVRALAWLVEQRGLWDDLLVLAGDNWLRLDLRRFVEAARGQPAVALFPLGDRARARRRYGVALVADGRLRAFQEKPEEPASDLVSTACYFFPRDVLPLLLEFVRAAPSGHDAPGYFLAWLLQRRAIAAFTEVAEWLDVGDRVSYIEANLRATGGRSWIHPEAEVRDAVVERSVVLGPARILRARLWECVVDEGVQLEDVELRGALVGRGSWLRG
ncbi:MAG: nucleotidyltransferase family protein [Candidatus Bipolaricaulota bacterium]|nr:nucleotidyltransferase family protein [Candidatus Bipolaricaulota bacterium]MCX7844858.1 nucleotidyltransferase family protein [Candidatus Bipolaricaulota bacterium]MDW8151856.1 nucleotidyltransferase family protein [Candidatus Bipolaricaulota bacterium]